MLGSVCRVPSAPGPGVITAKARGRAGGRPAKLTGERAEHARNLLATGSLVSSVAHPRESARRQFIGRRSGSAPGWNRFFAGLDDFPCPTTGRTTQSRWRECSRALFSNRVIHVPQKDRALYTALINTFCAILMGIAALQLAIKPEALMAPLAARGVTRNNWALDAMAIVTGIAFVFLAWAAWLSWRRWRGR